MAYRVPPKQILVYKGRTYGAGDVVPGYAAAPVKVSKKSSKQSSKQTTKKSAEAEAEVPEVTEAPKVDADITLTGEE